MNKRLSKEKIRDIEKRANAACGINYISAVNELIGHIDALDSEINQYRTEIDRLRSLVDEKAKNGHRMFKESERLQDDVVKLLRELKEAKEGKKVVLPREVAKAIDEVRYSKDGVTNYGILRILTETNQYKSVRDALGKKYIVSSFTVLMEALVNGYTIEEEPELTPKQKAIQYCIKHGVIARGHSEHDVVSAIMSILGTEQSG